MVQSFLLLQEHLLLITIKLQVADQGCITSPTLLQGLPEHSLLVHSKKVMQSAMQLLDTRLVFAFFIVCKECTVYLRWVLLTSNGRTAAKYKFRDIFTDHGAPPQQLTLTPLCKLFCLKQQQSLPSKSVYCANMAVLQHRAFTAQMLCVCQWHHRTTGNRLCQRLEGSQSFSFRQPAQRAHSQQAAGTILCAYLLNAATTISANLRCKQASSC